MAASLPDDYGRNAPRAKPVSMEPHDAALLVRMLDGRIPQNAAEVVSRRWVRSELERIATEGGMSDE